MNVRLSSYMRPLHEVDPEIARAIDLEVDRQARTVELIASENFVSEAVLEALGSVMTNKYAEGLPGKRYYGGCEYVDVAENLAIERAKKLFGAEHANVQAHSGSQANQAVYMTALKPGDTLLGMSLAHGGHLTHGHPLNFSGKMYKIVSYGVAKETETIDYDEARTPGKRASAAAYFGRGERLSALSGFRALRGHRPRVRCGADGGHGAYRRTGGCGPASQPLPACRLCHHHHAQNLARAARRRGLLQRAICQRP